MVRTLARGLVSLLVPPLCALCGEPEFDREAVCEECRGRLVPLSDPRCRRCGAPVPIAASRCRECRGRPLSFTTAWAPFAYEGDCRRLVGALKSRARTAVASFMAREIAARRPSGLVTGMLVPVPAHPARLRRHGFNQADSIARALGRREGIAVGHLLVRRAEAPPQVGLTRRARVENARGSVRFRAAEGAAPARAVLVDDVYTTGATLDACAGALREAGAREVVAVTFARAPLP